MLRIGLRLPRPADPAVRAWHVSRDLLSVFDGAWSLRACRFAEGLRRRPDHSLSRAQRPLGRLALHNLQCARLARGTRAGLREA